MFHLLLVVVLAWQAVAVPFSEKQIDMNPTENYGEFGPHYQGDIILTQEQRKSLLAKQGLKAEIQRWPKKTIPYQLVPVYNAQERKLIEAAIKMITSATCVKIIPRTTEKDYVRVNKTGGCSSQLGYSSGVHAMSVTSGCVQGSIAHEFLHALGIHHEQCRSDRDDFVTINFRNIQAGYEGNFQKNNVQSYDLFGTKYDYGSIMHYPDTAFGGGKITIVPKQKGVKIGQREKLSQKDITLVKRMYKC